MRIGTMASEIVEKINVEKGVLVIRRRCMELQTPDGGLYPADMDEYGQYQPIVELIRLISCDSDFSGEITAETRAVLQQALLGKHSLLSRPLRCHVNETDRISEILKIVDPKTESDYVQVLSLAYADGIFGAEHAFCPFASREDLCEYLRRFVDDDDAFAISELVRKGKFCVESKENLRMRDEYKEQLALLPENIVDVFSRIKYLPQKQVVQKIVQYAVLAANSVIKKCVI